MKTVIMNTFTFVPESVMKAFVHVQQKFPDVKQVQYYEDGQWLFVNSDGTYPDFGDESIDQTILENAADEVYGLGQICYSLPYTMDELEELWKLFAEVPVNEDQELDANFMHFTVGDSVTDVWHWFEDVNPMFKVKDMI